MSKKFYKKEPLINDFLKEMREYKSKKSLDKDKINKDFLDFNTYFKSE